ncbi:efflux RND transporter periplasmic adaptor subunit [Reichenbachiella agarivorans]|uniref:Efflux RND transporter periplasmic adaptor subunit n=1 Tax=Reichenbachiella agarivorans TaxID=2979464 RepID=A0ABY6CU14_9BACT|nr:efflux RND transporter periplasmic adaptor subunit [Reichenbachiella agarivorans]UXP34014.1 efflux RND transporter periplasmic adaptor subunit [Reichenbachiella agarivorans]
MDRVIQKKKWTVKRVAAISAAVLIASFILYNFVFADQGVKLKVNEDKIKIAQVVNGQFREFIPVDGNVLPIKTIRLDAIEGGTVEKKYLDGGILVTEGDTILKLSNNNLVQNFIREETQAFILVNNLENTKLDLQRTQFELKKKLIDLDYDIADAKDNYERGVKLREENVISEQEFLKLKRDYNRLVDSRKIEIQSQDFDTKNAKIQIRQTEQTLSRTRNNLKMIKGNLENLYIKAPISGRLSSINAEVGESIQMGQNIGQIDDMNGFKVRATIDEHYIARIYEGLVGSFDFDGANHDLQIAKIYPEVNNGLFSVDLSFTAELPKGIRRGQTLQIKLQLSENIEALQIPRGSFYQTTGGNWVFVVTEDGGEAVRRKIKLGRQNPRFYEVLEGLEAGDQVVVSSYEGYEDKDRLVFK